MEELTLEFGAAATAFVEAATDGRTDRAERLLALHPSIPRADFYAALAVGDAETVERRLADDPRRALEGGGPPVEWQTGAEPAESLVEVVNAWRGVTQES